jgi:CMP-N-acetylneuraminic acid synthetase
MLETPPFESTDIDSPDDWALAEVMVKYYQQKGFPL